MKRENLTLWVAILSFGAVAIAVILQFGFGMQPCAWCVFQRLIYLVVGVLALVAWGLNRGPVAKGVSWLVSLICIAGVVTALYQQFVAAKSQSCSLTLADRVIKGPGLDQLAPWLFQATAFCDEANVPLLKVPFAIWSAVLFAVLAVILIIRARRPR